MPRPALEQPESRLDATQSTEPKNEDFEDLLGRLASCHEQHVLENKKLKKQVKGLLRQVCLLRNDDKGGGTQDEKGGAGRRNPWNISLDGPVEVEHIMGDLHGVEEEDDEDVQSDAPQPATQDPQSSWRQSVADPSKMRIATEPETAQALASPVLDARGGAQQAPEPMTLRSFLADRPGQAPQLPMMKGGFSDPQREAPEQLALRHMLQEEGAARRQGSANTLMTSEDSPVSPNWSAHWARNGGGGGEGFQKRNSTRSVRSYVSRPSWQSRDMFGFASSNASRAQTVDFEEDILCEVRSTTTPQDYVERWAQLVRGIMSPQREDEQSETPVNRFRLLRHWHGTQMAEQKDLFVPFGRLFVQSHSTKTYKGRRASVGSAMQGTSVRGFPVYPAAMLRFFWCSIGTLSLAWDTIMIPVHLLIPSENEEPFFTAAWVIFAYWFLDMPCQCVKSYSQADGTIETRPYYITINYLKTWFGVDLVVLIVDGYLLFADLKAGGDTQALGYDANVIQAGSRSFRLARLIRLLRLVRLMRFRKLSEFLATAGCRIRSEHVLLALKLMKHIAMIVLVNHYIACAWCALALFHDNKSWLAVFTGQTDFTPDVYIMALHWSMTQFSPATNNISPQNAFERVFAVCVVLFAFISFSSFISSVTNTVNELRTLNMDEQREESRIREFLFSRKVSPDLIRRILKFFKQNYSGRQKQFHEHDIPFFKDVPESMKIRMHQEAYLPLLSHSPIFSHFIEFSQQIITQVCHRAFAEHYFLPQQDVFVEGMPADGVYFVRAGKLLYLSEVHIGSEPSRICERSWISELSILLEWFHCGHCCAETAADLVKLDKSRFNAIVSNASGPLVECLRLFAVFTLCHLENLGNSMPITDLSIGEATLEHLGKRARRLWELQNHSKARVSRSWTSMRPTT